MSFAHSHLMLRAHGAFPNANGQEKWSVGFRIGIIGADVPWDGSKLQTFVDASYGAFGVFHQAPLVKAGGSVFLTHATAARVGQNGRYDPAEQVTSQSGGEAVGGGGGPTNQPWTASCVISLRTAIPRGYASNGRVYWPMTAVALNQTTGRLNEGDLTDRLAAAKVMIQTINAAADNYAAGARVCVLSSVGQGAQALVTRIRSDTRMDSIERRENSVPPSWVETTIS